jgi:hypothetical protein
LLKPREIYGAEESVDLPNRKGTYKLVGQLRPPGLSKEEIDGLAAEQVRVMRSPHAANPAVVTIR